MQKQKEIEHYLSCVICKQKFNKANKPLIMFCSHNICEECKLKYRKKVICQTCGKVFSKREIKKFPINYAILETKFITMLEKKNPYFLDNNNLNQEKEENLEKIKIVEDKNNDKKDILENKNINNLENQSDKEKISINFCDEIIKEREILFKDTFDLMDNLEKNFANYLNIFFDSITKKIKTNSSFLIDDLNISQLLQESGVINFGDSIKLKQFIDIINDIEQNNLENCKSFNDIYDLVKKKKKDISYDQFISLFFFFNKVYELKIKRMPKILEDQKKLYTNEKENYSNLIHFLNNLSQKYEMKLSDIFYATTIYRKSHFIYDITKNKNIRKSLNNFYLNNEKLFEEFNNIIIFYEPIEKQLRKQILKIKELKEELIIDSYLILNQLLFILTDKKIYVYETNIEKYSFFNTAANQEIEKNTKIFKYDTFIMKISSNYFENINLRDDMSKNEWRSLSLYENTPGKIKKPYPICHSSDYVYVLDQEEKSINNIYIYHGERDFWEKKEIILAIEKNENEKVKNNKENIDNTKIKNKEDNIIIVNNNINDKDNNENIKMKNNDNRNNNNFNDKEKEELIIVKKLYLEDYFFFNKCYSCIFGGRNPTTKKFNKNIYMIDIIKGIIKSIINFDDFINDDMVIINLNVGILNKYVDFIFLYHFINKENNIKIKIIRKEVLENDISIESKLEVIIDVNICEILENK